MHLHNALSHLSIKPLSLLNAGFIIIIYIFVCFLSRPNFPTSCTLPSDTSYRTILLPDNLKISGEVFKVGNELTNTGKSFGKKSSKLTYE